MRFWPITSQPSSWSPSSHSVALQQRDWLLARRSCWVFFGGPWPWQAAMALQTPQKWISHWYSCGLAKNHKTSFKIPCKLPLVQKFHGYPSLHLQPRCQISSQLALAPQLARSYPEIIRCSKCQSPCYRAGPFDHTIGPYHRLRKNKTSQNITSNKGCKNRKTSQATKGGKEIAYADYHRL